MEVTSLSADVEDIEVPETDPENEYVSNVAQDEATPNVGEVSLSLSYADLATTDESIDEIYNDNLIVTRRDSCDYSDSEMEAEVASIQADGQTADEEETSDVQLVTQGDWSESDDEPLRPKTVVADVRQTVVHEQTLYELKDVPRRRAGTRKVLAGPPPSGGRNTFTSMRTGHSGFFHNGILSLFMNARREGIYNDDGFGRHLTTSVVVLEIDMWMKCRNLFPNHCNIHVDASIWGTRSNSKRQYKGVQTSATKFRRTLGKVFDRINDSQDGKVAIFLIVGQVNSTDRCRHLALTNVLVASYKDGKKSFVVFDPLMPTKDAAEYLPVKSTLDFVKEAITMNDDQVLHVVFGKQDGTSDCLHRAIDFVGRIMEGDVKLNGLITMPYPITTRGPVTVPACFYGGI